MFLGNKINVIGLLAYVVFDSSSFLYLPLVRLGNVLVELEALRVGEGALVLDSLAHEDLLHGNLDLLGLGRKNYSTESGFLNILRLFHT